MILEVELRLVLVFEIFLKIREGSEREIKFLQLDSIIIYNKNTGNFFKVLLLIKFGKIAGYKIKQNSTTYTSKIIPSDTHSSR